MISFIAHAVASMGRSAPRSSAESTSDHVWALGGTTPGTAASSLRAGLPTPIALAPPSWSGLVIATSREGKACESPAHQPGNRIGDLDWVKRMRHGRVGPRPVREPGVLGATDQHKHRRTLIDLVLELPGDSHSPGRHGFAVEDDHVDAATVHPGDDSRLGGALHVF